MRNDTSGGETAGGEGDGGSPSSTKEPLLGAVDVKYRVPEPTRCMRQHLRRQLNGIGRIDLATGEDYG